MSPLDTTLFAALDRHEAALVAVGDNPGYEEADEAGDAYEALCAACRACGWDGGVPPNVFALKRKVAWLTEQLADLNHGMSLMHSADQGPYLKWRNAKIEKKLRENIDQPVRP